VPSRSLHLLLSGVTAALAFLTLYAPPKIAGAHPGFVAAFTVAPAIFLAGSLIFTATFFVATFMRWAGATAVPPHHSAPSFLNATFTGSRPAWGALLILCFGFVFLMDARGLLYGFFRLDDFEFLRVARVEPVARQLLLPHGGHVLPLYRLETLILSKVAASSPWLFNLATYFSCAGMLLAGSWLLIELGAGWTALVTFVVIAWIWPGWCDFTAGYYSNVSYVKSLVCGLLALAALVRAGKGNGWPWLAVAFASALLALGYGLAGSWIIPAMALFAWAAKDASSPDRAIFIRRCLGGLIILSFSYALLLFVTQKNGGLLGPPVGNHQGLLALLTSVFNGLGGLIINLFVPAQFAALSRWGAIRPLQTAAVGALIFWSYRLWPRLTPFHRRALLALTAVVVTQIAMVSIARRPVATGYFWPPKWVAISHSTLAILFGFCLDRQLRLFSSTHFARGRLTLLLTSLLVWLVACTPMLLASIGYPNSRANSVRQAQLRRSELSALRSDLEQLSAALHQRPVILPPSSQGRFDLIYAGFEGYPLPDVMAALPAGLAAIASPGSPAAANFANTVRSIPRLGRLYRP
jgi:hypothetical protein